MIMTQKTSFATDKFPPIRQATVDLLTAAKRKNMIHSMIEVDVTKARQDLRKLKRQSGKYVSFTGYIIYCTARAVDNDKHMHSYRNRKGQLILFDEVDVSTTIERKIDGRNEVVALILRNANHKSLHEISDEIRDEKHKKVDDAEVYRSMKLFLRIPAFLRRWIFRIMDRSPGLMKEKAGTIMVTSAGMFGHGAGWGVPIATHTLNVTIGSIVDRVVEIDGRFGNRQHVCLTLSFDHDIIDGAPAARFIRRLSGIIEKGILEPESQYKDNENK